MLDQIFSLLVLSPTFQACILDFRTTHAMFWPVAWADLGSFTGGTMNQSYRQLKLNKRAYDHLGLANAVLTVAHEYRHAWQATQRVLKRLFVRLDDQIINNRKIEGDAVAFELTVAYELRDLGHPEIWNESIEFMLREHPECIKAFTQAIKKNAQSLWNGRAQNAVLLAWQHNRQRSAHYEARNAKMFQSFNRASRRSKAIVRSTAVDDSEIDALLFKMPYAIVQDGKRVGVRHRGEYGKLMTVERSRLTRVTRPASLLLSARLASHARMP